MFLVCVTTIFDSSLYFILLIFQALLAASIMVAARLIVAQMAAAVTKFAMILYTMTAVLTFIQQDVIPNKVARCMHTLYCTALREE